VAFLIFLLAGCQELRGPVWSPDSKRLAYASYSHSATGNVEASVYVLDAEDENAEPELVAKNAAFPNWTPDGQGLFFLGESDGQGFYSKIFKWHPGGTPQAALTTNRVTCLQMSLDASTALLCHGQTSKPGAASSVDIWRTVDDKAQPLPLNLGGDVYSPALMPNGKYLAYSMKVQDALPQLLICKLDGSRPEAIFPTEKQSDPDASIYIIHAFPDNDRFLFYAPAGSALWSIRRDGSNIRKYSLPEGLTAPLMVSIADDSSFATVTLVQPSVEKIIYQVYRLDFNTRRFTRIDGDSGEMLGGHALKPSSARRKPVYAWFSAAGLAVGEPGQARYYPLNANQCVAASTLQVKQGDAKRAIASALKAREFQPPPDDLSQLDRAEALAYLADKQIERAAFALERSILLYPVGPEGLRFIFPAASGLPRMPPSDVAGTLKEIKDLTQALPENRLLPKLGKALAARDKGDYQQALQFYREAFPIVADDACGGGIRFLEGLCAFEAGGDLRLAAEKWEQAARSADFPQVGYAAGLSAIAYCLADHSEKATTVLQLTTARNSPLATELNQLPSWLNDRPRMESEKSKEVVSADGATRCWVEYERCQVPFASLVPRRVPAREGKYAERRIGTQTVTVSSVWLAGTAQPIYRIPRVITAPKFSPNGALLAFAAAGEVFPLADDFCDLFVIDRRGTQVLGDSRAAFSSQGKGRHIVKKFDWLDSQQISVSGSEVDVFGGETPFSKTIQIPTAAPRVLGK